MKNTFVLIVFLFREYVYLMEYKTEVAEREFAERDCLFIYFFFFFFLLFIFCLFVVVFLRNCLFFY